MQPQHHHLSNRIPVSYGLFLVYLMTLYTEDDVQNALTDLKNGYSIRTATARHGVPRTTLQDRLKGAQTARQSHADQQRLSVIQEDQLEQWILRQEALGYAPTHSQVRSIATGILRRNGDHQPLGKKWCVHFI